MFKYDTFYVYLDQSETNRKVHNYQVFLSNTTRRQDGVLCIDDAGPIFPLPGAVKNCPALARFVIFHNAVSNASSTINKFSQICEVKVEGKHVCLCEFREVLVFVQEDLFYANIKI